MNPRFDDLYPDTPDGWQPPHDHDDDGAIKTATIRPCWNCQRLTAYVDLDFEAHLCCEHCRDIKWHQYFQALKDTACGPSTKTP
jgi:hypothetical protein